MILKITCILFTHLFSAQYTLLWTENSARKHFFLVWILQKFNCQNEMSTQNKAGWRWMLHYNTCNYVYIVEISFITIWASKLILEVTKRYQSYVSLTFLKENEHKNSKHYDEGIEVYTIRKKGILQYKVVLNSKCMKL